MLMANEACYGKKAIPSYLFNKAKTIVSLGADFLGTWLSPVEFTAQYAENRRIKKENPSLSKHIQFESNLSLTGSNADDRYMHKPSETGSIALALLAKLGGAVTSPAINDAKLAKGIEAAATALSAAKGEALVVCGSNDANIQLVVNAINEAIGANGTTINWAVNNNVAKGLDSEFVMLTNDIDKGAIGGLLVYGVNPVYSYIDGKKLGDAIAKLSLSVSYSSTLDETAEVCKYIVPAHHWLESWGDAEPHTGNFSLIQPVINPLFKTRQFEDSLLALTGAVIASAASGTDSLKVAVAPVSGTQANYSDYFKSYWLGKVGGNDNWEKALQDGVITPAAVSIGGAIYSAAKLAEAVSKLSSVKSGKYEVVLYQKISVGNGSQANNPWLQELPDPVSKATWDNYALISMKKAEELGIKLNTDYEYYPQKPVITFTIGKKEVDLPILVLPGMNADTIAIAVGYGRSEAMGVTAAGIGTNAYPFAVYNGTTIDNYVTGVKAANQGKPSYKIAQTQIHNSYEDRKEVVRETTIASFKKAPNVIPDYSEELKDAYYKNSNDDFRQATLYPQHEQPGIKWGMNIDMNACFGCGACVVSCHAENNVSVVGKREVLRYHDMHWLRIDRYFISDDKNPDELKGVVFQPMLCQHCDNAPCENVCPVAATNHSSEGLNQMTYNRCIGTRYCANNCPFKVRRFNWADYTGADSFPNNRDQQLVGKLDSVIEQMNDDLTRMVLNPDVTVRSRGVIEKCSFCVQKLQAAKLDAKKENRMLKDGDAKTACQTACPADAIVFGNAHDKESQLTKIRQENKQRSFHVLEQLHVLPNITYLAKVRNSDEIDEHWAGAHGEEHKEEGHKEEGHKADSTLPSAVKPEEAQH